MKHLMSKNLWLLELKDDRAVIGMFANPDGTVIWEEIDRSNLPDDLLRVENGKLVAVGI